VLGNDYIYYYGLSECRIGGLPFGVSVIFDTRSEKVATLILALIDTSIEEEEARDRAHKSWLCEQLPGIRARADGGRRFPWGMIEAMYVPQNAESWIIVSYGKGMRGAIGRDG
jgi:hypothetical protein